MSPKDTHIYGAKTTAKNTEQSAEKPEQSFEKMIEKKYYANIKIKVKVKERYAPTLQPYNVQLVQLQLQLQASYCILYIHPFQGAYRYSIGIGTVDVLSRIIVIVIVM